MSLSNPNKPVTEERLQEFYHKLVPYMGGGGDDIQVSTMPTASVDFEDAIVQYVGETDSTYTNGYFYKCVEESGSYSWVAKNVQAGGGGGGGHTIEDSEGTDLTQRDTLQFGEGFLAEDDSTNEKTIVTPDVMQSGDMDDVITPLPSVQPRYQKYSTEEQVVGEWIDGKPLYQKTINFGALPNNTNKMVSTGVSNLDRIYNVFGWANDASETRSLPYVSSDGNYIIAIDIQGADIRIITKRNYSDMSAYVTIQYTKTTS